MKIKALLAPEPENRDTYVNNSFIMNYMKEAPSGFVRIYLYFLMDDQLGKKIDIERTAEKLAFPVNYVKEALDYWQETGVIDVIEAEKPAFLKERREEKALVDEKISEMFTMVERVTKRPLSNEEVMEISSWLKDYTMTPEAIVYGYTYANKYKATPAIKYVETIIREWADLGLYTAKEIEEYLEKKDLTNEKHKRIFKALGFSRYPTEAEREMMDKWFNEDGFIMDQILDACSKTTGISNPNLNYINSVLLSKRSKRDEAVRKLGKPEEGSFDDIYFNIREKNEKEAEERRKEVYRRSPGIKIIDEEIKDIYIRINREALSGNKEEQEKLKERLRKKNEDRAYLITDAGFSLDYTAVKYNCESCHDTGMTEKGLPCKCREEVKNI